VIRSVVLSVRDFIICGRRVVSPGFLWHYLPSDGLFREGRDETYDRLTNCLGEIYLKIVQV